jgi:hypothetical protein
LVFPFNYLLVYCLLLANLVQGYVLLRRWHEQRLLKMAEKWDQRRPGPRRPETPAEEEEEEEGEPLGDLADDGDEGSEVSNVAIMNVESGQTVQVERLPRVTDHGPLELLPAPYPPNLDPFLQGEEEEEEEEEETIDDLHGQAAALLNVDVHPAPREFR